VAIQLKKWLSFFGEAQDSRIVFNHHVPDAVPYQNIWDIRQGYVQLGSSTEGWADVIVGRQVLAFGDERVIGPSDWVNAGRTFDAARFNVHQAGYQVSLFASSVVAGADGAMDHHIQGNDLYGAYALSRMRFPKLHWSPTCCGGLLTRTRDFRRLPTAVISTRRQSACAWRAPCRPPSTTR
jgi:hypothetical protein